MKLLTGQEIAPSGSIGGFRFFKVVEHFNWPCQFCIYLYPAQFERDGVLSLWYRIAAKLLCPDACVTISANMWAHDVSSV